MEGKTCSMCKNEKHNNNFYKKYSECRDCNSKSGLKRYHENKDKLSNQRKIYFEKKTEMNFFRNIIIDIHSLKD